MHNTKNPLDVKIRKSVVDILGHSLADSIDMIYQVKQAHWNVQGPSFIALHKLFDEVAEHMDEFADLIAERIRQLGGTAEGTIQAAVEKTSMPEYPLDLVSGKDHVEQLATAMGHFSNAIRESIIKCDKLGDPTTADVFTEISRGLEKDLWFVESHLLTKEEADDARTARATSAKRSGSEERPS